MSYFQIIYYFVVANLILLYRILFNITSFKGGYASSVYIETFIQWLRSDYYFMKKSSPFNFMNVDIVFDEVIRSSYIVSMHSAYVNPAALKFYTAYYKFCVKAVVNPRYCAPFDIYKEDLNALGGCTVSEINHYLFNLKCHYALSLFTDSEIFSRIKNIESNLF